MQRAPSATNYAVQNISSTQIHLALIVSEYNLRNHVSGNRTKIAHIPSLVNEQWSWMKLCQIVDKKSVEESIVRLVQWTWMQIPLERTIYLFIGRLSLWIKLQSLHSNRLYLNGIADRHRKQQKKLKRESDGKFDVKLSWFGPKTLRRNQQKQIVPHGRDKRNVSFLYCLWLSWIPPSFCSLKTFPGEKGPTRHRTPSHDWILFAVRQLYLNFVAKKFRFVSGGSKRAQFEFYGCDGCPRKKC